jgi:hypothetical protein
MVLRNGKETAMKRSMAVANLVGLILGVTGGVMLAVSLSIRVSNYRLVEAKRSDVREVVICHANKIVAAGFGGPLVMTDEDCPTGTGPSDAAVVETNNEEVATLGLYLVILGFLLQCPSSITSIIAP